MAAGRVDAPSRRDHLQCSTRKEFECRRNVVRDLKLSHDVSLKNGYHPTADGHKMGFQHRKGGDLAPRQWGLDDAPLVKDDDTKNSDHVVQQPPQKRMKFSPIIWDIGHKEVRISSGNRVVSRTTTLLPPPSPKSLGEQSSTKEDVGATRHPLPSNHVKGMVVSPLQSHTSDSSKSSSPLLISKQPVAENGDQEQNQVDDEEGPAPNILKSRWASDSSDDEDEPESKDELRKESSPESGEIIREGSEGNHTVSCGSDRRSCSMTPDIEGECREEDVMDIDNTDGKLESDDDEPTDVGVNMLLGCRSVDEYEKLNKISEGTYGIVYRAKDKKSGNLVALKKIKDLDKGHSEEYGFPVTSLREINILASFHHPSIVNVREVVVGNHNSVFMVMEYLEHDLRALMGTMRQPFSTSEVKCLMLQLLEGVKYLHDDWVLHRDLKTSNLLLNNKGELKICDFGMARQYGSPLKPYTTKVVTQWYRAPELLLGAKKYSTAVDMWSVGCIMAELLAKEPFFKGTGEIDQLRKIFDTLGTPNEKMWPGFSELPGAKANFPMQPYNLLRKKFPAASFTGSPILSDLGLDLLNKLLTYDPVKRISAEDALNHAWFREVPLPKCKEFMPTFPPKHG